PDKWIGDSIKMEAPRSIRALIVEDEALASQTIKDFVQGQDWLKIVGEAADGDSAVTLIDELRPDLVFLDVRMPGLTGLQVLESISNTILKWSLLQLMMITRSLHLNWKRSIIFS